MERKAPLSIQLAAVAVAVAAVALAWSRRSYVALAEDLDVTQKRLDDAYDITLTQREAIARLNFELDGDEDWELDDQLERADKLMTRAERSLGGDA